MRPIALLCAGLMWLAAVSAATAASWTLTVTGGPRPQRHVPIRALVHLPAQQKEAVDVQLVGEDGTTIPGQLTDPGLLAGEAPANGDGRVARELHAVLDQLPAEKAVRYTLRFEKPPGPRFTWHEQPREWIELRWDSRPVLRYMNAPLDAQRREETYKVFHHLFDPAGEVLLTKGPGGQYTHHRGLFYGFNKVTYGDGRRVDIWHCSNAHQAHEAVLAAEAGAVLGRHTLAVSWNGPDGVFARETRELAVYRLDGAPLVEFASRLETAGGPITLDGDPQHAGFHFRASNEVASSTKGQTYYLRPTGADKPGATRNWPGNKDHVNLPWNAMSFVVGGARYTAVYLDHPDNPKEARYSERDYGRFGSYFEYTVDKDRPLVVRYRVYLVRGELTVDQGEALHQAFVSPPKVAVSAE